MINVFNNYGNVDFDYETIINDVWRGLISLNKTSNDVDISLILVGNDEIQKINKEYRQKDYVTDVISFEDHDEENYLGDIFICIDRCLEQAHNYEHSVKREFAFLLCHGCLHLLGYDHLNEEEEKEMFAEQDLLLNYIGYTKEIE